MRPGPQFPQGGRRSAIIYAPFPSPLLAPPHVLEFNQKRKKNETLLFIFLFVFDLCGSFHSNTPFQLSLLMGGPRVPASGIRFPLDANILRLSLATTSRAPHNPGNSTAYESPGHDWSGRQRPNASSSGHWLESGKPTPRLVSLKVSQSQKLAQIGSNGDRAGYG